jgi:hypothetical protein
MNRHFFVAVGAVLALAVFCFGCAKHETAQTVSGMTDDEIENLVRRSYQYAAMYNVINKNAMVLAERTGTSAWNACVADTELKDHTFQTIARPNNDTLYTGCMLDLRAEPVIIEYPAFDSKYAVLETSAYDHYCEIPLSTTFGDFREPSTILYYTARTQGYSGEPVEGVDRVMELSGDFAIAFLRVMPHATEPERMERNIATMQEVKAQSLSEYLGEAPAPAAPVDFPAVGTDLEIFGNNFLEVMQFVLDHTTFDADDEMDRQVLEAFKPLGLAPQTAIDANAAATYDGQRSADAAGKVAAEVMAMVTSGESVKMTEDLFKPKGEMSLEPMVLQSVTGPIGVPADQAVYVAMVTSDGEPMNALNDYVIRMSAEELPPAEAFWSVTLYDLENGFFIPNDQKKYSVGENAGMNLDKEGGIEIHIAAEQPAGVPDENWLPLNRGDYEIDAIMRIYAPDLERFATWIAPTAEKVN